MKHISFLSVPAITLALAACGGLPEESPAVPEEVCVLETSMGTMVLRLLKNEAPATVRNFKGLVGEGFYDGLPFYRVVAGHVIQAGDGGENDHPAVIGEFGAHPHVVGAVGLARDEDPDSGSTEFYICHAPRPHLDGRYAVFGLLIEGLDVLERIGKVEVEEHWLGEVAFHKPTTTVVIERAYLEERVVESLP
jgi:cyclophilin family peptidyl-prolyl cis-trans isomerase